MSTVLKLVRLAKRGMFKAIDPSRRVGGHRELWSDHEGHNIARWPSERGIAAFALSYRIARKTNSAYTVDDYALADMQRTLRLVRSRAAEWRIATNRIGVMGFSAGAKPPSSPSPTVKRNSASAMTRP
jgi:hypothetical protein